MNKKKFVIGIGIVLFLLIIGATMGFFWMKKNTAFQEISYSDLQEKLNNQETFFFVITQTGCTHCSSYRPIVEEVLKEHENVKGYDLNITKMSEEDYRALTSVFNFEGTPITIFIQNGYEKTARNRIDGKVSKEELENKLNVLGYLG